jgi:hypothetical protein
MDTHWFAVDRDGRVGLFFTAENGFYPVQASDAESTTLVSMYQQITGEAPPGLDEDGDIDDWDEFLEAFAGLGFFRYEYIDSFDDPGGLLHPYTLTIEPDRPLHADQLPSGLRTVVAECRFDTVRFGEEQVQPLDVAECQTWWEGDVAYLRAGEKVVRPIRGHEEKYQEFCAEHAATLRASRKGLVIEGLK